MRVPAKFRSVSIVTAFAALSCTGTVSGDGRIGAKPTAGAAGAGGGAAAAGGGAAGAGGTSVGTAAVAPPPASWRRLTASQYRNTIDDLFGPGLDHGAIEATPALDGFSTVGGAQGAASAYGVEQFELAAQQVAAQVVADAARFGRVIACAPAPRAFDSACARRSLASFGRRVFRRPLTDAEVDRYEGLWRAAAAPAGFAPGAAAVVSALLQSPKFLYRTEYGQPVAGTATRRYTGYELASRLSYFLWNTTPDDALLEAAARGALDTDDGIRATAEAMLISPRARAGLDDYFAELLRLDDFGLADEASRNLPPSLAAGMRRQALLDLDDIVFDRDATFSELVEGTTTHVDAELARHYGLPTPTGTGFVRVTLPQDGPRTGFLTFGAFLVKSGNGLKTSPVRRGKLIREGLLCQAVPPPPPNVDASIPELDPSAPRTTRQRLEQHRSQAGCSGCHALMDPLGLPFEIFDASAKLRATENGLPIDPSGELDGQPFATPRGLAHLLATSPKLDACTVSRLYRYASGAASDADDDRRLAPLREAFRASGGRLRALILAYVGSALFLQASDPS